MKIGTYKKPSQVRKKYAERAHALRKFTRSSKKDMHYDIFVDKKTQMQECKIICEWDPNKSSGFSCPLETPLKDIQKRILEYINSLKE